MRPSSDTKCCTYLWNSGYSIFVNCWHMGSHESALLWKCYCPSGEGVAIKSSYGNLAESLNVEKNQIFHIGIVKYIDYKNEMIPEGNLFFNFLHKRLYFKSERELRVIAWIVERKDGMPLFEPTSPNFDIDDTKYFGFYFPVDLNKLVEAIYLPPSAPDWLLDLTRIQLKNANLGEKPIIKSGLDDKPIN